MVEPNPVVTILEALVEQTRAIRDVKIQVESLKQMMFAHRPAFVPTFDEKLKEIASGDTLERLDGLMASLESAVSKAREG